ncbi:MAG: glycoside hydrolase family 3 C-terminal domain-containing protein, partial [Clostridia bacterium]|nr:glycoside hydrolase family 3 C-terminal domain-containing protein [Clostridia bacterium]
MDLSEAKERARELVGKMTVDEKISQLLYTSEAVERLGIHEYNWWNEAAHGVARAGNATVFPQAIGLAASFDPELIGEIGRAVADEARAKYNKSVELGDRGIYKGLTFWAPNINIFRDGRWGRGQETFGEDPFLTAALAVSYIKGLQGDGDFIKAAACAKHFAVHSGPEKLRHGFNALADRKEMWETYLPAFEKCVEAGVAGVMGAYNRTNGQPCCANDYLMTEVLFGKWGFEGYFVSDCGAVADIYSGHHYTASLEEAAALALKKGCCLNCGKAYSSLTDAYEHDLVDEEDITAAAEKLFAVRFMLGEFEEKRPFADIPYSVVGCEKHRELNLEAARRSLVLLKNRDGFLPVGGRYKRIAVIGPNSDSVSVLEGNYNGTSSEYLTVSEGMRRVFDGAKITVERGSPLVGGRGDWSPDLIGPALAAASESDLTVLCLGLDPNIEGEEMAVNQEGFD